MLVVLSSLTTTILLLLALLRKLRNIIFEIIKVIITILVFERFLLLNKKINTF